MVPSPITSHPSESPQFPACPQHLRQVQLCQCLTYKEQSLYYDLESESGRAMCLPHLETPEVEFTNFLMQLTNQIYFLQNFTNLTYFQKGASSYFNSNHNDQDMAFWSLETDPSMLSIPQSSSLFSELPLTFLPYMFYEVHHKYYSILK